MHYRLCRNTKTARTTDYIGSIASLQDYDYLKLKENCRRHNAEVRATTRKYGRPIGELMRVRLMGRGPRVDNAIDCGLHRRGFDSYLPINLSKYFDVYYGVDSNAMYQLKRELDTGLTPGELAKLDDLQNQLWEIQIKGTIRKRRNS